MGRGGARPGSGRKRVEGRKILFICPKDLDDWLQSQRACARITDIICAALYEYKRYREE